MGEHFEKMQNIMSDFNLDAEICEALERVSTGDLIPFNCELLGSSEMEL